MPVQPPTTRRPDDKGYRYTLWMNHAHIIEGGLLGVLLAALD